MIEAAAAAGALGAKVCGAGGGGCLFCFAQPGDIPAVRNALAVSGAELLDFTLESQGLRISRS
jgi:D-glycero-alpha-D-manno-heptose-7-phosphate kinase